VSRSNYGSNASRPTVVPISRAGTLVTTFWHSANGSHGRPANQAEGWLIGAEGMLGASVALGVDRTPLHALVQGSGSAWRTSTRAFRKQLADSAALRRVVDVYLYVLMAQLATSSACVRFRDRPTLARSLLRTQDRAHAKTLHVTHEFLAQLLGVRRVGITVAAGALQDRGVIAYRRRRTPHRRPQPAPVRRVLLLRCGFKGVQPSSALGPPPGSRRA
jgi:hypothetical protein